MFSVCAATQFAKRFDEGRQHNGVAKDRRQAAGGGVMPPLRHAGNDGAVDSVSLQIVRFVGKSRSLIAAAQWQRGATAVLRVCSPPTSVRPLAFPITVANSVISSSGGRSQIVDIDA